MFVFYDRLEYFTAILCNFWSIGIGCGHLVYFLKFWYVWTKTNLATPLMVAMLVFAGELFGLSELDDCNRPPHYCDASLT
jgi:hypothetical protein